MEPIQLDFEKMNGLLPVVAQDWQTGEVLMMAYLNPQAWELTLQTGKMHYFSRTKDKLWMKGESSGHVQLVKEILVDCDRDSLVVKIEQVGGAACHVGYNSCFYRRIHADGQAELIKSDKVFDPEKVYGPSKT